MFVKQSHSSKWAKWTEKRQCNIFPLTIADMDFPLFGPFKNQLVQSVIQINNLTYKDRSAAYFHSILDWYERNHSLILLEQYLVECPSLGNLAACSILAFTRQNQGILVFTPVYQYYFKSIQTFKRKVITCEFDQEKIVSSDFCPNLNNFKFNKDVFINKMKGQRPKLIILCHPHNPCGKVFNKSELDLIASEAENIGAFILSDEIMGDFCQKDQNKKFISMASYSYDKIIVGNSISKVFNCESVQGGYGIIKNKQVREKYNQIARFKGMKLQTNQMSIILTPIVYSQDGDKWIKYINRIIKSNYQLMLKEFGQQKLLKIFELESSYLVATEFDSALLSAKNMTLQRLSQILEKFGIYFTQMNFYFYPESPRLMYRIAIAVAPQQFEKFIKAFKKCIQYIKKLISDCSYDQLKRPKL